MKINLFFQEQAHIFQVGNDLVFIDFFTRDKFEWKCNILFNPFFYEV
jgi:hypothetical protein